MKGRGGAPSLGWALRGMIRDRAGTLLLAALGGFAVAGIVMMIYGAGRDSHHLISEGGEFILLPACFALPGMIGYWVAMRKRKIRVEDEMADLKETLLRMERNLGGGGPRGVVRPLRKL